MLCNYLLSLTVPVSLRLLLQLPLSVSPKIAPVTAVLLSLLVLIVQPCTSFFKRHV